MSKNCSMKKLVCKKPAISREMLHYVGTGLYFDMNIPQFKAAMTTATWWTVTQEALFH